MVRFGTLGLAVLTMVAACGRSEPPERQVYAGTGDPAGQYLLQPFSQPPARIRPRAADTPELRPQPRLAELLDEGDAAPRRRRPPIATFSTYGGVPAAVDAGRDDAKTDAESPTGGKGRSVPPRDVVDLGLDEGPDRDPPANALRTAALPTIRPVSRSPEPRIRPSLAEADRPDPRPAVTPAPPSPSIASLPSLRAPRRIEDAAPSALPLPIEAETAIPIGAVPASLGGGNIQSAEAAAPAGDVLERSAADESGALGWQQASALIRAGEVRSVADIGEFELLLTLCSGRGVLTIQPTPDALETTTVPEVVCGEARSLTSR